MEQASVSAWERVGAAGGPLMTARFDLRTGKEIKDLGRLSPVDRLRELVNTIALSIGLEASSREELQELIGAFSEPEIINPAGVVAGYLATGGRGRQPTRESVKRATEKVREISQPKVSPVDMVRYARFIARL